MSPLDLVDLERLARIGNGVADEAVRRLPVPHHRSAAGGIATDAAQRRLDRVALHREGHHPARRRRGGEQDERHPRGAAQAQARRRSWCISGSERMRFPVAAEMAFSTAGAATMIVGSPTPPQKPPDGMTIVSTCGISARRMTW